ncbi:MAG: hypothetical protein KBC41_01275 [Candidatus Pacebacteria bacterium]|nr:hypothetical protein [Candidatus Paceibacterota bacterium]MBP9866694.1 hypothetical protein [Candidatus Paceibacterota bacterium]
MDESFFLKYSLQIKKQKDSKEEVLLLIKEKTGILLDDSMITLLKKNITFSVSSVIKQKLFQKDVSGILKENGYTIKL